ncbi:MAG TPA: hypothetical protein VHP38_12800 [Ruminiclostridium sp.]|nr:hypothetical protein [Ruminiclostridium sp.]
MLNSTDKKAVSKTIIVYVIALAVFVFGWEFFNQLHFIKATPQIKAVLALLLVVAVSFTRISTELSFLICGILGSFIMGIPLSGYAEYLFKQASSASIFVIAVSGAVIAALARNDLLESLENTDEEKEKEKFIDLEQQSSVFCLFSRLQGFILKIKKTKYSALAFIVFLFQNMLLFVSSVVSAQTFSAMLKTKKDEGNEKNTYINAGILCMCVSGCLLMFFFMKSPWWLFFTNLAKDVPVHLPIAVLIYAFLSFSHGYYLLSKADTKTIEPDKKAKPHPLTGRYFTIFTGLIVVFLAFTLPKAVRYLGAADRNAAGGSYSASDYISIGISLILILIMVSIIAATVITRRLMNQNSFVPSKGSTINELKDLILGDRGIKSVISAIVLIVTILGFKDMVNTSVGSAPRGVSNVYHNATVNFFSLDVIVILIGCVVTFAAVMVIGKVLGSNFGAFSIGWIVFGILSTKFLVLNNMTVKKWVLESIIIISTYCNQTSPQSSNAGMLTSKSERDSRSIPIEAWKVESIFKLSARKVQIAAAAVCVLLSGVFSLLGIS